MKKIVLFCLFILIASLLFAFPSIAVIDFDAGSFCTIQEAVVMTDAFRNEMVRAGKVDIVTRNRIDALKTEIRFQMSDWTDPNKIKQAGHMLGVDYIIFGRFGIMGNTGYLQVEMTDVETARILYSSRMALVAWREFDRKINDFVRGFINNLPVENIFSGIWTGNIFHNNIIDNYTITFTGTNRCTIRITSLVNGQEITEVGQGTYSYSNNVLKIMAVLRNSKIPHLNNIQWSSVISVGDSNKSFNMACKPTSKSTDQYRITFTKE